MLNPHVQEGSGTLTRISKISLTHSQNTSTFRINLDASPYIYINTLQIYCGFSHPVGGFQIEHADAACVDLK